MDAYRLLRTLGMTALLVALAMPVAAVDSSTSGDWQFAGEAYLWGASIGGRSAAGDDIDIDFDGLIDNLDMGLMATLAARKDKWSLYTDIVYLDVEDDQKSTALLIGRPIQTDIDVELKGWIVTAAGGYSVIEADRHSLELLGGARYLWLEADLEFDLGATKLKYSDSGHIWDGIVGMRGKVELADKWYLTGYLDAGAGDSDSTWQAKAALNYRFRKVDAVVGYRYLDWDFDDNDTFDDLNLSGPYAGVKFRF